MGAWWTWGAAACAAGSANPGAAIPPETTQLVLVEVAAVDAPDAVLTLAVREGEGWRAFGTQLPAKVGLHGVAWGIGLHEPQPGRQKQEGDLRTPLGLFRLGAAYRDDSVPPLSVRWPVEHVGARDLWVEDPASPWYNAHLVVAGSRPLEPWEETARMALGDPYLRLKVFVAHNAPTPGHPARAGAGSAIFLHAGAPDGSEATSGCVAIDERALREVVGWLDPDAHPLIAIYTPASRDVLGLPPVAGP